MRTDVAAPGAAAGASDPRRVAAQALSGGAPLYPLIVLFGLNAVDQLDQRTFASCSPRTSATTSTSTTPSSSSSSRWAWSLGLLLSDPDRVRRRPRSRACRS